MRNKHNLIDIPELVDEKGNLLRSEYVEHHDLVCSECGEEFMGEIDEKKCYNCCYNKSK